MLRAPTPSGVPGTSVPGPEGSYSSTDDYDQALLDQYNVTLSPAFKDYFASASNDVSKDAKDLSSLLLSPRGIAKSVRQDGSPGLELCVCRACFESLKRQHKKPPTFAIANKFLIGELPSHLKPRQLDVPEDAGSTQLEFDLIRPIYLGNGWILVVQPGRKAHRARDEAKEKDGQKALSGHWYCTQLDTGEVASKMGFQGHLPLALVNVPLRAVLTGALTPAQRKLVLSSFEVRRAQVGELLDWYNVHNKHVRKATKSSTNLADLPVRDTQPAAVVTCDWKNAGNELGCGAEAGLGSAEEENHEASYNILATATITPAPVNPKDVLTSIATKVATLTESTPECASAAAAADPSGSTTFHDRKYNNFHVSASNRLEKDWDKDFLVRAFIELFPFGRGGPDEQRLTHVSLAQCVQHYMRLSTGQFLGHRFVLAAYGIIARSKAASTAFVKAKNRQGQEPYSEAFANLTPEQVATCASYLEECKAARKRNAKPPPLPACLASGGIDKEFFDNVRACCASMPHTHEAAGAARKDMYGFHYKFGKATLFVTINPDDKNALVIHFLCGGCFKQAAPPPLIVRNVRIAEHPGAAALFHERFLQVLVALILGWDSVAQQPFQRGGIFGHVKAFMGPNEEQVSTNISLRIDTIC